MNVIDEPNDGDLVSDDTNPTRWFTSHWPRRPPVLTGARTYAYELRRHCETEQFWPDVWLRLGNGSYKLITATIPNAECPHEVDRENYSVVEECGPGISVVFSCRNEGIGCKAYYTARVTVTEVLDRLLPREPELEDWDEWSDSAESPR